MFTRIDYRLLFFHKLFLINYISCIISDPNFTGFKPLPEEHRVALTDLLISRNKYFIEGISVGHNFMSTYTGDKRLQHADKKEFRDNLKMGLAFFVGTCLLDYGIAVM